MKFNNQNTFSSPNYVIENMRSLRALRKEKNISATELSKATGINKSQIYSYEIYGYRPTKASYNKFAKFFGWKIWE